MSNQPQGKKAHDKQLGPITKSLDRGRGRGHRAALAVWFTTLIRGPQWTIHFGSNKQQQQQQATATATATSNSNKQQVGFNYTISGTPIAQGPKLRAKGPLRKALLSTKFRVKTHRGAGSVGKKVLKIREIRKS